MNQRIALSLFLAVGIASARSQSPPAAARTAPLTVEQAFAINQVADVQLAPDGRRLAFSVALPVKGTEHRSQIWVLDVASRKSTLFTNSGKVDRLPRWSPDGRRLAFVSNRAERFQLYQMPVDGGEAQRLTDGKNAVSAFEWAPDGKSIAFLAPEPKTEAEEKRQTDKDDARVVRADENAPRLWLVDVKTKAVRQLTRGAWHVNQLHWAPKGDQLFIVGNTDPDGITVNERIFTVNPADGALKELFKPHSAIANLQVSPDGTSVSFVAAREDGPVPHDLFLLPAAGGAARNITAESLDRLVNDYAWLPDGRLLVTLADGFHSRCVYLTTAGQVERIDGLASNPSGRVSRTESGLLAYAAQTAAELPEVWLKPPAGKAERVTEFNKAARQWGLITPEIYRYKSFDGLSVEAALYRPAGASAGTRLPLAVLIHGGPTGAWEDRFNAWTQLLVARGYAVFAPNIRGSTGYGWQYLAANRADWGGKDFKDVMAGVDDLVQKGVADPDRLGIAGWSYGGYMAAWAITQTPRFKAAVAGACMSDLASEFGTESGPSYDAWFYGVPYEKLDGFLAGSPVVNLKKARTPTLILHGENDNVDPIGQAQQLHRGLKHYGVPCEFVIYPREPHGLGEEKHVLDAYRRVLEWFDKHLKPSAAKVK